MSHLYINGRKLFVPGKWDDLTAQQLVKVAATLHADITVDEARTRVLFILLHPRRYFWLSWLLLFRMKQYDRLDFLADARLFIEYIFDIENVDLTRQLLPVIKITRTFRKRIYLYGPADRCKNLVFMEFIKAETYYLSYRKNYANVPERLAALDKLVAVLYRPKQSDEDQADPMWNGDIRQVYNDNLVETRLPIVSRIDTATKYAILMHYDGCRKVRINKFRYVFPKTKSSGSGGNWIDALRSMAGGAMHMEKMAMVDCDTALYDLDKLIEESKKRPGGKS